MFCPSIRFRVKHQTFDGLRSVCTANLKMAAVTFRHQKTAEMFSNHRMCQWKGNKPRTGQFWLTDPVIMSYIRAPRLHQSTARLCPDLVRISGALVEKRTRTERWKMLPLQFTSMPRDKLAELQLMFTMIQNECVRLKGKSSETMFQRAEVIFTPDEEKCGGSCAGGVSAVLLTCTRWCRRRCVWPFHREWTPCRGRSRSTWCVLVKKKQDKQTKNKKNRKLNHQNSFNHNV